MELRCRAQKANESLQASSMGVERLVQLTYLGENQLLIDTLSFVLAQETTGTISRPQVSKVRKMEGVEEEECLLNELKSRLKQVGQNGQKSKPKCFNCGKGCHFQRNCKAPPSRNKKRANYQLSSQEFTLNQNELALRGKC